LRHERRGIGAETVRKYIDLAKSRIRLAANDELPVRPMNRPVFDPKDAGRNLLTAPWLTEDLTEPQMALLEKTTPYRTRK